MAAAPQPVVAFRLAICNPAPGFIYSLQGNKGLPVDAQKAGRKTIVFQLTARIAEGLKGPRFLGDFVRAEGERRFFYVASGILTADGGYGDGRRAKIDFPEITPSLLTRAKMGGLVMEAGMEGAAADGAPARATIKLSPGWTPA